MKEFMSKIEDLMDFGGVKKDIIFLCISGAALFFSITGWIKAPFNLAWVAVTLCGVPIILEAIIGLTTEFDIKADVLVSIALIAAICIREDFAAGEVAFIMQLGALLEDITVVKARAGIEKLVKLTPKTARVIENGTERITDADEVKKGEIIRVLPGESIPVDGVIVSGTTSIDQSVMTGESVPVDKSVGDEVASGTINQFGVFEMRATKVGEDSSIQRMIKLVQSADAGKAKIVGTADKWAVSSDIAIEAADIALVDDDVKELPHLLSLSKRMMNTIKLNMSFSMGLNFIAIVLAITGILNPIVGALVHNAGSIAVIINSSLLLRWKGYI
ncbi:e1-E2 ATPase [Lachnospiraceae bacterium oral taxon 082 str. F0431]|nr:e1-E2 ATPase [Lachnospiraceae bacterium oral taxon 082 str. F0431]